MQSFSLQKISQLFIVTDKNEPLSTIRLLQTRSLCHVFDTRDIQQPVYLCRYSDWARLGGRAFGALFPIGVKTLFFQTSRPNLSLNRHRRNLESGGKMRQIHRSFFFFLLRIVFWLPPRGK